MYNLKYIDVENSTGQFFDLIMNKVIEIARIKDTNEYVLITYSQNVQFDIDKQFLINYRNNVDKAKKNEDYLLLNKLNEDFEKHDVKLNGNDIDIIAYSDSVESVIGYEHQ
jgi:hypothetical protein